MNETDPTGREQSPGRFRPGQSGNPAGRPRGSRDRALAALDAIGDQNAAEVLQAVVTAAKGGDIRAADVVLSRLWPSRKGRAVAIDLPVIRAASDLPAAIGAVVQAVATGEVSPEEGQAITAILEGQRKAIETADLARRIEELEKTK